MKAMSKVKLLFYASYALFHAGDSTALYASAMIIDLNGRVIKYLGTL